ncbi:hypothetical protein P8452_05380 [Trifolium repens]|nr:hypothetical protein P8452_05380 [Trifolium repens]
MSQDYVENEKDFAPPPPKELEVEENEDHLYIPIAQDYVENEKELEGEEDNSSVPISQDSDREAIEAFNRWRQLFEVNYTLTTEEERRFKYFKNYFNRKVNPTMEIFGINLPQFADRNKQEFNDLTSHDNKNVVFSTGLADSIAVRMVQDQFSLPPVLAMLRIEKRNRIKLHSNYGVQDMQSFLNDKTADPDNPGRRAASFIEDNYDAENKQKDSEMINFEVNEPVVVLGFGQMGQVLANLLSNPMASGGDSSDGIGWPYVAFDIDPRVVKAARKQGFPILYGDGSRPVVLQSAGIFSPKAIMIMLTEKKKSIEAFHRLRLAFPAVPIYARARDVKHLLDLKKAGATDATLEKAETSLQLGSKMLKGLGMMFGDVSFLSQLVRDSMELQTEEAISQREYRE